MKKIKVNLEAKTRSEMLNLETVQSERLFLETHKILDDAEDGTELPVLFSRIQDICSTIEELIFCSMYLQYYLQSMGEPIDEKDTETY